MGLILKIQKIPSNHSRKQSPQHLPSYTHTLSAPRFSPLKCSIVYVVVYRNCCSYLAPSSPSPYDARCRQPLRHVSHASTASLRTPSILSSQPPTLHSSLHLIFLWGGLFFLLAGRSRGFGCKELVGTTELEHIWRVVCKLRQPTYSR